MRRSLLPTTGELVAFESSARWESFSRAAVELDLTQAAVSRLVRSLEQKLSVQLFSRVRQRLKLTGPGLQYYRTAKETLALIERGTSRIVSSGASPVITIAVLPTFGVNWLIPRLRGFYDAHPEITLNIQTRLSKSEFVSGEFDLAIHLGDPHWIGATAYKLVDEAVVAVCSPAFKRAHSIERPEDLLEAPLVHHHNRTTAWEDWFVHMRVEKVPPAKGPRYEYFGMAIAAARAGLCAAIVPKIYVENDLADGHLQVLFENIMHTGNVYYLLVSDSVNNKSIEHFLSWIIGEFAKKK